MYICERHNKGKMQVFSVCMYTNDSKSKVNDQYNTYINEVSMNTIVCYTYSLMTNLHCVTLVKLLMILSSVHYNRNIYIYIEYTLYYLKDSLTVLLTLGQTVILCVSCATKTIYMLLTLHVLFFLLLLYHHHYPISN